MGKIRCVDKKKASKIQRGDKLKPASGLSGAAFAKAWNQAASPKEVAKLFGLAYGSTVRKAALLRKQGLELKHFRRGPKRRGTDEWGEALRDLNVYRVEDVWPVFDAIANVYGVSRKKLLKIASLALEVNGGKRRRK